MAAPTVDQLTLDPQAPAAEEWRAAPGWDAYEVSSLGRVRRVKWATNTKAGGILKPGLHRQGGYRMVNLWQDGRHTTVTVHALVCEAFKGPKPSPRHEVAHWDGKVTNNVPDNLRWATRAENNADKERHGKIHRGEARTDAKLTDDAVRDIRRGGSIKELARKYNVSWAVVYNARRGKTWKHVL